MSIDPTFCTVESVTKTFEGQEILHGIDLEVSRGSLTVVAGQSGSGKSTLMNCMAGLDAPTMGLITHEGVDIHNLDTEELTRWRGKNIGFVFQSANLLGGLNIKQNIVNPHKVNETTLDNKWLLDLTNTLGIKDELLKYPRQLSGGQRQRVAIARALAHKPNMIFADEPTAALDSVNREEVYGLFRDLVEMSGVTVVMIAHDDVATSSDYADRVVELADGKVLSDTDNKNRTSGMFNR